LKSTSSNIDFDFSGPCASFYELIEKLQMGVAIIDAQGNIAFLNKRGKKVLGYNENEELQTHFRALLALDDLSDGFRIFYNAMHGRYSPRTLLRLRKKDASTSVCEVYTAPFYQAKMLKGTIAFFADFSAAQKIIDGNKKRVQAFTQFSKEIDEYRVSVRALQSEVNAILVRYGAKKKYDLSE